MNKKYIIWQFIALLFTFSSCNALKFPGKRKGNNGTNTQNQTPPPQQPQVNEVPHAVTYNFKNASLAASPMYGEKIIYASTDLKRSEGTYGSNTTYAGSKMDLQYFFTAPNEKSTTKRPFVLLIHGGGFLAGTYKSSMAPALLFAQRGYAAASIDYRLGWNTGGSNPGSCKGDTMSMYKAVYRATQDARAALRYFIANADQFGIDTSQIFIWGSSAGNIAASAVTFMTQQDFDVKLPGIENSLGSLYTASNNLRNDFHIKALLTVTGFGLISKSYINSSNAVPVFFMVRANDPVLPYGHEPAFKCKNYFLLYGASEIKNVVKSYNMPYTLYTESGSGHQVGYTNDFVIGTMSNFVKSLWSGDYRFLEYADYTNKMDSKAAQ